MTGEITLRGRVLPVGGIKEKVLAAHRAGIKHVIMPERNVADLEEVPQEIRDELEFVGVTHMDEVLTAGLDEPEKLKLGDGEREVGKTAKRAKAEHASAT